MYQINNSAEKLDGKIKFAVLSNFTCDEVNSFIQKKVSKENIDIEIYLSKYNQIYSDLLNHKSDLYLFNADIIFIMLDENFIMYKLKMPFEMKSFSMACEDSANLIDSFINNITEHSPKSTIIITTMVFSKTLLDMIIDYHSKNKIISYMNEFNRNLLELSIKNTNIIVLDISFYMQEKEIAFQDTRLKMFANMSYDNSLLERISKEIIIIIKAKYGLFKKCLILDLDNTLWGGIIGDDGIENIKIGGEYEGVAFQYFQKVIKQLQSQGIMLAINSKNNIDIVEQLFDQHPEMILKRSDFVGMKINWNPKHENIKELSSALNIGLDSLVFVDDSHYECESVKKYLPEVTTILLPDDPAEFSKVLLAENSFNKLSLTFEDRQRTEYYFTEQKRTEFIKQMKSNHDLYSSNGLKNIYHFLDELKIKLRIFNPQLKDVERILQLCVRTNQFNLTGLKFSFHEIEKLLKDQNYQIFAVEYIDKFGESGIIGAIFLEKKEENSGVYLYINNIVLSCRVFNRGVEESMLLFIINYAKKQNITCIIGLYKYTEKNKRFQNYYLNNHFKVYLDNKIDALSRYLFILDNKNKDKINHLFHIHWINIITEGIM